MAQTMERRTHGFHRAADADAFARMFEAEIGMDIPSFVAQLVAREAIDRIIAAGSIPLGLGTGISNLNFFVLVDDEAELERSSAQPPDGYVRFTPGKDNLIRQNIVARRNGIEIGLAFCLSADVARVYETLRRKGAFLSFTEVRVLSGIRRGWPVFTARPSSALDAAMGSGAFEIYCATANFVESLELLEDAPAALDDDIALAAFLARRAVEQGLRAYLASRGYAYLGEKWLWFLNKYRPARAEEAAMLDALRPDIADALFPRADSRDAAAHHVAGAARLVPRIRALIETDSRLRIAFAIAPQIAK